MHIGGIEHEVRDIKSAIERKADRHDFHSLRGDLERLERAVGEIRSEFSGIRSQLESMSDQLERIQQQE